MAPVAQPISLLASVRAQLSPGSDSGSSASAVAPSQNGKPTHDHAGHHQNKSSQTEKTNSTHDTGNEEAQSSHGSVSSMTTECISTNTGTCSNSEKNSAPISMHRPLIKNIYPNESTSQLNSSFLTDLEPFPEYNELNSPSYIEKEQAYKGAFAAAMQDEIRAREVDPFIEDSPIQPEHKRQALEDMKNVLSDPELRSGTRRRFIALTNLILRLDYVLFRRSPDFLNPAETADAQLIANLLLGYVAWADGMVKDLLDRTAPIYFILGQLVREDVSEIIRYRRMGCVVSAHLKKPRALEQRLLAEFRNLYDQVHDQFLLWRNHQILVEEGLAMDRLELTRFLHAIWEVLSRLIENYALYRDELNRIKRDFFTSPEGLSNGTIDSFVEDLSVE